MKVSIWKDERYPDFGITEEPTGQFEMSRNIITKIRAAEAEYGKWQMYLEEFYNCKQPPKDPDLRKDTK